MFGSPSRPFRPRRPQPHIVLFSDEEFSTDEEDHVQSNSDEEHQLPLHRDIHDSSSDEGSSTDTDTEPDLLHSGRSLSTTPASASRSLSAGSLGNISRRGSRSSLNGRRASKNSSQTRGPPTESSKSQLYQKVRRIIAFIKEEGLTLAKFMDALSWGNEDCASDSSMASTRRHFFESTEFPILLRRWSKPPGYTTSHKAAPEGAKTRLTEFAIETVIQQVDEELSVLDQYFRPEDGDSFRSHDLIRVDLEELVTAIRENAPVFWEILDSVATTARQKKRNTHKNPTNTILITVAMLLYSRSHYCNKLQRLFAIYLKYKGLSTKGCDTLHSLGLAMSSKWVTDTIDRLSKAAMEEVEEMIQLYAWNVSSSPDLHRPPPVNEIPCGPEHISHEYMLGTMHISETSYEGVAQVMDTILDQLGFKGPEARRKLAEEIIIFWLGDQLTTDRIRNLQKLHCQDFNADECMDNALPVWGWLHALMAWAKSLHKQYLGTEAGYGFRHAFGLLNRYDLLKASTQGPFHEKFERLMEQILEAHIRALWCVVGGVKKLEDLLSKQPSELLSLARFIVDNFASASHMHTPGANVDEVKVQTVMFVRDLLRYFVAKGGIRRGDVGLLKASLPSMLFRFVGGRNSHYSVEFLETLQGLYREWPQEVCDFVTNHCWVLNLSGKRDSHVAADRVMEAGINRAKVICRPKGPNVDWEYLKKLHPVLPVIGHVSDHMEEMFQTWTRYKAHTSPHDTEGILLLQHTYMQANLYQTIPGRRLADGNKAVDYIDEGVQKLEAAMNKWAAA
ncbi:hypothetical protein K474DRAFT_1710254 [Panus rudis PR-1116 ss-1]|nr:hypothetical protein K474DRAFT_1710254 [Panus rudis PR-1116 ss-1]